MIALSDMILQLGDRDAEQFAAARIAEFANGIAVNLGVGVLPTVTAESSQGDHDNKPEDHTDSEEESSESDTDSLHPDVPSNKAPAIASPGASASTTLTTLPALNLGLSPDITITLLNAARKAFRRDLRQTTMTILTNMRERPNQNFLRMRSTKSPTSSGRISWAIMGSIAYSPSSWFTMNTARATVMEV